MGCLMPKIFSDNRRKRLTETEPQKTYSWSNRDRSQASKFIIENQSKSLLLRSPGEINGEQFIIQNCFDSIICLFDYSNTVTIDDCRDCVFFIGPVMGRNNFDFFLHRFEKSTKIDQCFDSLPKTFIEGLTFDPLHSLIPRTYGIASLNDLKFSNQNEDGQQNCIILVYCYSKDSSRIDDQVYRLIKEIKLNIEVVF
ncbi:hypothetical protein NH340_JMT04274 [Sarcoptes scabiei]|nr:hypothetical protein NH340_JMT04274 [Sarcoptes scabiei]